MEVQTPIICGNDDETCVLATSYTDSLSILFRFSLNPFQAKSVDSRIVACFHEFEVDDPECSFSSRAEMRQVIYASVGQVWDDCASHPSIQLPDIVVQIEPKLGGGMNWRITHESSHQEYVHSLVSSETFQTSLTPRSRLNQIAFVSLESLRFWALLSEGRGDTTIVGFSDSTEGQVKYVYKGMSFRTFLTRGNDFEYEKQAFYRELAQIHSLPRHPNIVSPPKFLVDTRSTILNTSSPTRNDTFVCGALYPYFKRGSLQDALYHSNVTSEKLPLALKAKWACQIASAMVATHASRHYHMDLKPSNIIIDDEENAFLIDWEQTGASPFFLAPEADGSWDVKTERVPFNESGIPHDTTEKPELIYRKYTGAPRENNWVRPKWNVFPIWQIECPEALRAAEVYSFGRTLWVMLEIRYARVEGRRKNGPSRNYMLGLIYDHNTFPLERIHRKMCPP